MGNTTIRPKVLGVIPARFDSTRFPGKPLVDINGKSMIHRVYIQAMLTMGLDKVVVATDDERIFKKVEDFGGYCEMTSKKHQSGTDRCAEVASRNPEFDVIINIQGDEPYIAPEQIDLLISCFQEPNTQIATLIKRVNAEEELFNTNIPKVLLNKDKEAIYFSRQTVPFLRNIDKKNWIEQYHFFKHIGIYGYRKSVLDEITQLKPSSLELAENLEQLRWIENGFKIKTEITEHETIAIDTPEDLEKVRKLFL